MFCTTFGNALNTINISASYLEELFSTSELIDLSKISDLLEKNKSNLAHFISEDPKGKNLPDYIVALAKHWKKTNKIKEELHHLINGIQDVIKIIKTQQSLVCSSV